MHDPAEQMGDAPGPGGQTLPHVPQFVRLLDVIVSQPLAGLPSQSP